MKKLFILSIIILTGFGMNAQNQPDQKALQEKAAQLVSQLTLEEKASLCSGKDIWSTQPVERLAIPSIWMSDGPHGLRRAPESNLWGYGDQAPSTCFPTASALAATWDTSLIYKVGQALGEECQALGVHILLGPGVNIKRSVLGGRNFEFFSEDPVLSGEMGAAFINGVQSQGVGTSLKHYVANNVETQRMWMNSDVDTRTLNEIYLTPFEIAVKKSQPWTVMACYNRVQGIYGTQSPYLLTEVLRDEWGYEGIVVSDWYAVVDRVEGIKAGMNIEMPGPGPVNDSLIVEAVKNGELDEAVLDELVEQILTIVLKAKSLEKEDADQNLEQHHQFARQVASESVTLLKNEDDVLPITKKKYKKIAIIGEFAQNPRFQGNGSSEVKPAQLDNILDILENEYGKGFTYTYSQGYSLTDDEDISMVDAAVQAAAKADIAMVFAGLPLQYESEGIDRKHINMPASHNKLIDEVAKVQQHTVVVLTNGSAIAMPWVNQVDGIVESWLGGQAGAGGTADVLFGTVNPSGKIAETFPVKLQDTPAYFNFPGEEGNVLYGERIFVGYRYYDEKEIKPQFPFGYGLSYTTFDYTNMTVSSNEITDAEGLTVTVTVKNTGNTKGKEVVQLYVSDKESSLIRPEKELKKFAKIELEPGQSKEVTFKLEARDFSYFDSHRNMWIAESGDFVISAAASSRDIRQQETINLKSTQQVPLAFDEYTFFTEYWKNPQTQKLIIEMMPSYIAFWTPEGKAPEEAEISDFMMEHPMVKMPYITQGEISAEQVMELVEKCKDFTYTP